MPVAVRRRRQIRIRVFDADRRPAEGADLAFFIDNVPYGSVTIGNTGQATFEQRDTRTTVEVMASFGGSEQRAQLTPKVNSFNFNFDIRLAFRARRPPIARCPDGTTGQPCVECVIDGEKIRICS
jgi:hypothetical protein